MKRSHFLFIALLALSLPGLAFGSTWNLDPDHSNAQFKVQHMMVSQVRGDFPEVQGTVVIDEQDITRSVVDVTIATATLSTNHAKRDGHLKSADFFDVEKYPTMTFKSRQVKKAENGSLKVLGDLTIHGVTKEVELQVTGPTQTAKDPWGNSRKGAQATAKVNRKDFGLVWNKSLETGGLLVGDEVEISIEIELIQQAG